MTTHPAARSTRSAGPTGWVPFALVALVVVPGIAGTLRLVEIAGGPLLLPADARMTGSPLPVVVHVCGAVPYAVLGAFQFSERLRRRHPLRHRVAGRLVVVLGLAVALSGLWMTLFYARQPGTGPIAFLARLAFGSGMAACVVLGLATIRRGDVAAHLAWMTRAYALALGAGTQTITLGVAGAVFGASVPAHDLALAAAWVVNLAVAEAVVHRRGAGRTPRPAMLVGSP